MGYTHYFMDLQVNRELSAFAKNAVAEFNHRICGPLGTGKPTISPTQIKLNGSARDGEDYEGFVLPAVPLSGRNFCKTSRMPYDAVVTAILIAAIALKVDGWDSIDSDGDVEDWIAGGGVDLFIRACKRDGKNVNRDALIRGIREFLQSVSAGASPVNARKLIMSSVSDAGITEEEKEPDQQVIEIKYHTDKIDRLKYVGGAKSDWIDLRAAEDVEIKEGEFALISLGISVRLPHGYEMIIVPRSSTFKNFGVLQTNGIGVIDESYCGDGDIIRFPAYAVRDTKIHVNDRLCQFRIQKHQPEIVFQEREHLGDTDRGGFGSTGTV